MIVARNLLTGVGIGVVVALLVQQIFAHGFQFGSWSVRDPHTGRTVVTGALIGAVSQMLGQAGGRR